MFARVNALLAVKQAALTVPEEAIVTMGGNGKNDTFRMLTQNMAEMEVIIFDRWGKQVGELKRPEAQWNPKEVGAGTYYYSLHALGLDDEEYNFEGSFTVLEDE
jgi:gliding motility-associated-like protein